MCPVPHRWRCRRPRPPRRWSCPRRRTRSRCCSDVATAAARSPARRASASEFLDGDTAEHHEAHSASRKRRRLERVGTEPRNMHRREALPRERRQQHANVAVGVEDRGEFANLRPRRRGGDSTASARRERSPGERSGPDGPARSSAINTASAPASNACAHRLERLVQRLVEPCSELTGLELPSFATPRSSRSSPPRA